VAKKIKQTWLDLVPGSERFKQELNTRLSTEARESAGIDVHQGFVLMPVNPGFEVKFTDQGVGYFDADLVGPDAWGSRVQIAWMDASGSGVPIKPEREDLPPGSIKAWWSVFPADELRARYSGAQKGPEEADAQLPFSVEWSRYPWPDVWMIVRFNQDLSPNQLADLTQKLERFRESWNNRKGHGRIHNWNAPAQVGARAYEIHVDFGSAPERALVEWLTELAACGCEVESVAVRGFPEK
jgi:hypothetical protein